jgi:hypothetical protein
VSPTDVTVNYATSDGTATAGRDYVAIVDSIRIPAGQTSGLARVDLIGDTRDESSFETFNVTLSGAVGATISPATASGTIVDDDPTPSLRVNNVQVTEGNSGKKYMSFRVSLSGASGKWISVNW